MEMELIFFNPLMLALVGYLVVAASLTILVQPLRIEMVETIEDLLSEPGFTKIDQAQLERLARNCMSFFVALVLPLAIGSTIVEYLTGNRLDTGREASAKLRRDPRFHRVLRIYFVSILASSPILGIISSVFIAVSLALRFLTKGDGVQQAMESPVIKAVQTHRPHMPHAL
ncbi:MAG: hypothetical protein R3E04_00950 [Sphingobium sp.]